MTHDARGKINSRFQRARDSLLLPAPLKEKPEPRLPRRRRSGQHAAVVLGGLAAFLLVVTPTADSEARRRYDYNSGFFTTQITTPTIYRQWKQKKRHRTPKGYRRHNSKVRNVSLVGLHPVLVKKAHELQRRCGCIIISARAFRRNRSLHPSGRAMDAHRNPECIRKVMKGWKGGMSNDYWRVARILPVLPHYHISWGGSEHGTRFAHRNPFKTMFARSSQ